MTAPPPFRPSPWARGPHAQTLLARWLRPNVADAVERERFETPDGDFFDVDWSPPSPDDRAVAVVLHGLEGTSTRAYVRSVCRRLSARGVRTAALNFRGCSGEPNHTLPFYHSGDTRDLVQLLRTIRARHPELPLGAMGFSLGGNVLLKAMGEQADGGGDLLDAAAAMSVPFDLDAGAAELDRTRMGRVYTEYFLRSLRTKVAWKRDRLRGVLDLPAVDAARSIRGFDAAVTAPLNGFSSAEEYYARCSSGPFIGRIRVPTLLVHALDDPFLPPDAVPRADISANPAVSLALSPHGGHVGFMAGPPWAPRFQGDEAVADHLANRLAPVP